MMILDAQSKQETDFARPTLCSHWVYVYLYRTTCIRQVYSPIKGINITKIYGYMNVQITDIGTWLIFI
jgi:hypothetical protein